MSSDRAYAAIAHQYARDVVAGKIPACKWTKLACQRHLDDIQRSHRGDLPFIFDAEKAARTCAFIEELPHPKGEWAARGELIRLEPWQVFNTASIFGWVERADSTRNRFHEVFISVARKNAKSTYAAGIAIYKYSAEGEAGAEVYFGAPNREKAMDVGFVPALAMIESSPDLCAEFGLKANKKSVTKPGDRTAVMKTLVGKPGDGASPVCAIIDEYHEHPTDAQYEAMKSGMGARKNPLLFVITTAGTDLASPCRALQDKVENVLDGVTVNERLYCIVYTLDEGDDWTSLEALKKANPNYGVSVYPAWLESEIADAGNTPSRQPRVKTKNANIWVNSAQPWITIEAWKACADPSLRLEDFEGESCIIGLDLADRVDLAAKVRAFTRTIEGAQHYFLFTACYLNQERIREKRNSHFQCWADQQLLIETPGNVTSYPQIADDLVEDSKRFRLRQVPHDPHHAGPLVQFIQAREDWDQEIEFIEFTSTAGNWSPAMRELEAAVLEGRVHHDGNPILAWAIANVICKHVGRDLVVPDKKRNEQKIDPAVAALMAFNSLRVPVPNDDSIYNTVGFLS